MWPQEVLHNLMISAIEFRGEEDPDVAPYRHATAREIKVVEPSREVGHARALLMNTFRHIMAELGRSKVMPFQHLCSWMHVTLSAKMSTTMTLIICNHRERQLLDFTVSWQPHEPASSHGAK